MINEKAIWHGMKSRCYNEKHRDLEKQFNLKLTFTNFIKYLINQAGVK